MSDSSPSPDHRVQKPWVIARTRVPYGHTDQMAHVYYGTYFLYFEMGRNEWMRAGGLTYKDFEEQGFIVPVAEAHAKYKGRVFYDDVLEIWTAAQPMGRTRFKFIYEIRREGEEQILTSGWSVHAVVDTNGKPMRVPPMLLDMLERLGSYEGNDGE